MTSCISCLAIFLLIVRTSTVYGDAAEKSSLTFVIDDTMSMWNEISQVKDEVNAIFETVLSSNASQIENFILVTFNDPDTQLRTVTKDRVNFKNALAEVVVHGGDDCPEYAITGIETALKASLPKSYLYVFTDAAAKDYNKYEQIKTLSQKRQSQVDFLLTGDCGSEESEAYQVYRKVAYATNGQVFHMMKDEIKDILQYVKETVNRRDVVVVSKRLQAGYNKIIEFFVDNFTDVFYVILTGDNPKIGEVTGPGGSKPKVKSIIEKKRIAIAKVTDLVPGTHDVKVGSKSETDVKITAKTDIHFQLGFSTFKPSSISETATRPTPDGDSFLSVKLYGEGVKLLTAKITDMSNNVITELPLELVDDKENFYVAPSFNPPHTMFRVSVSGYDVKTKTPITRTSPTPVERQNPSTETKENVAPKVMIEGAPKLITEYDGPLQLKCKVHGYPRPDITWVEKDTGLILPATVSVIEVPYDYISIVNIDKVNKSTTYRCNAKNAHGDNIKDIEVERKVYFEIVESPTDVNIEYNKEGSLVCKVNAYPPATITWLKNGKLVSNNTNIEISKDMSVLTIKHMQPHLQGEFMCEVRNDMNRKRFYPFVGIFGLEKPIIDKEIGEIFALKDTSVEITCRVIQGTPKPTISWLFQREGTEKYEKIKETSENIYIKNAQTDQAGTYKCIAKNVAGSDRFAMNLRVGYPPTIKDDVKLIRAKDGDKVIIPCEVDGVPTPLVEWYFNDTLLTSTRKTHISGDHSLKFRASTVDSGYYVCYAENELGITNKTVHVKVISPVNIEIPKESTIKTMVGKNVVLPCLSDGDPKPDIKWDFHSTDPKIPPKDVTPSDESTFLKLLKIQLNQQGYYTCIATNSVGVSANITYEVMVYAPPVIENVYTNKKFEAVVKDLVLTIQCKATGSPKPTITWKKDGLNLAIGTEWYDMEEDGTLIIKNINRVSQGTYVCLAENILGNSTALYEVDVREYPSPGIPTSTIFLEEGEPLDLICNIPHMNTDFLRWYKDGKLIATGEYSIHAVTQENDGLYTCRVSDFSRSRSAHTKVVIGYKPKFVTEEEEDINFELNNVIVLACVAIGKPEPKVIWKHNGKEVSNYSEQIYPLEMTWNNRGKYDCEVTNKFGSIHRSFNIRSKDCIFDTKKDFPEKQPLILTKSVTPPTNIFEGHMVMLHSDYFFLYCPSEFLNLPSRKMVMAFCEGDSNIKLNGVQYQLAEIKCNKEAQPEAVKSGKPCLPGNTEYIQIGYRVYDKFIKAYDVCFDKVSNTTLFTKHMLSPHQSDISRKSEWFNSDLLSLDFNALYDCRSEVNDITSTLGRHLSSRDSCCFARRQLVNYRDLRPGLPAAASFTYLNVIPHWSTCNSKNWDDVEERVRNLVKPADRDFIVLTGTASLTTDVTIYERWGGSEQVNQYLWKVVQDPLSSASLAIIQVNVPDLSPSEVDKYVLCPDICNLIDWMKGSNWNNVKDGFTYCCTIKDFENAFDYNGVFSSGMNKVLFDIYYLPEHSLTKK